MTSHLLNKIHACSNSYRGKSNPRPCGIDWCHSCPTHQIRTDLIVQAALNKFRNSNTKLYHAVADIGPIQSFDQGRNLAIKLLHTMAQYDIECIGTMHYADPKQGQHNKGTNTHKPFYQKLNIANAHLHYVTNQYQKASDPIRKNIFKLDYQLYQIMQGLGRYKDQTTEEFVVSEIEYGRNRQRIQNDNWFQSLKESDQQLSFMVSYGEVFIWDFDANDWRKSDEEMTNNRSFQEVEKWRDGWKKGSKTLGNCQGRVETIGPVMYTVRGMETDKETDPQDQKESSETVIEMRQTESKDIRNIGTKLPQNEITLQRKEIKNQVENLAILAKVKRDYYSRR